MEPKEVWKNSKHNHFIVSPSCLYRLSPVFICFLFCSLSITRIKRECRRPFLCFAIERCGLPVATSNRNSRLLVGRGKIQGNVGREEESREGLCRVLFSTHYPLHSPSFYYQATGHSSGGTVGVLRNREKGKC